VRESVVRPLLEVNSDAVGNLNEGDTEVEAETRGVVLGGVEGLTGADALFE
jgi:hypothetical protein